MADRKAAWGIDIGQAGLKAVKLRYAEAAKQAVAVAFDYVPHPKILSQPDAIPEELIPQALETFLSRNTVKGDLLAISVPGQTSLAKFIKLPPVESSKVAEIVKYEARQQIPFDLDDVIWDYQPLGGGIEESGFMLEAEVGLFAMKREQVAAQMQPFIDAGQEVEIVQTAPLALYNFLSYDVLGHRVDAGDPIDREEHIILLDMGADNTTLLVSNGRSIWIRNVPLGGNHFTRALTKEMKLTFAKAEHLKCNATRSPDPRAVFQALRPVFNDYVSEIQRSIGYFASVNREAKIQKVLGVGNGFKLAGLQKFLQQNLQYEVERVDSYKSLVGDSVLNASLFQDNVMSFTVPYGLALQALDQTRIRTTLLPPEIAMERKIRSKKPWAIAAAAGLLSALTLSALGNAGMQSSVSETRFSDAHKEVGTLNQTISKNQGEYSSAEESHKKNIDDGQKLTGSLDRREMWLEVYKAINEAQPREATDAERDETDPTKKDFMSITSITAVKNEDLKKWFEGVKAEAGLFKLIANEMHEEDVEKLPEGEGYVFTIVGTHYKGDNTDSDDNTQREFIRRKFLANLQKWILDRGNGPVPVRKAGITHAFIRNTRFDTIPFDPNVPGRRIPSKAGGGTGANDPMAAGGSTGGGASAGGLQGGGGMTAGGLQSGDDSSSDGTGYGQSGQPSGDPAIAPPPDIDIDRKDSKDIEKWQFIIEFCWRKTPPKDRLDAEPAAAKSADDKKK